MSRFAVALEFPEEGRWSVGIGWSDEWPVEWRHAQPSTVEKVGVWTIYHGAVRFDNGELLLRDAERVRADGLREVRRRWRWTGQASLETVTLSVRAQQKLTESRPFLPGINYYGNPAGQSVDATRIPVIGTEVGARGFYEEHRFPMPVAAVEGRDGGGMLVTALHSVPSPIRFGDRNDQWWSLGIERFGEDRVELALLSGPVASNGRNGVIKGKQRKFFPYPGATCTLPPGAIVDKTFYLQDPVRTERGAGFQAVVAASLSLFDISATSGLPPYREILDRKLQDSLRRWREGDRFAGIDAFPGESRPWIDLGWAGQSEAVAFPLIVLGEKFGVEGAHAMAQKALDFISTSLFTEDGFSIRYDYGKEQWLPRRNPLSQGQAMNNLFNALRAARRAGNFDTSRWEAFLRRACEHHAARILRDDWHPVSTNEAFLIAPLVQGAELLGESRFLDAAKKAAEHYLNRHRSMDEPYWGGTLDARCEDKEGAWAAMQGFLAMYEKTGDRRFLEGARHAGDVVLSYMYVWDVPMPAGRLADHAFRSRGWTAVSVQNMHLDVYGVLCAPAFWRLGELTGCEVYKQSARLMSVACGQLTDPWGSAGEQLHQTNYAQHYDFETLDGVRGDYVENWNVYWISAHFLTAAAQFAEMGVDVTTW